MLSPSIKSSLPKLKSEFSLITVQERIAWRTDLPKHLLSNMRSQKNKPLPEWKIQELIEPTLVTINELLTKGTPATVSDLQEYYYAPTPAHWSEYAT